MGMIRSRFPAVMFVITIIVLLLVFFSIVNIADNIDQKINAKTRSTISGNTISVDQTGGTKQNNTNDTTNDYSEFKKPELYQTKSIMVYYLMMIGIIATILIVGITLRTTILENIKKEEEQRRL